MEKMVMEVQFIGGSTPITVVKYTNYDSFVRFVERVLSEGTQDEYKVRLNGIQMSLEEGLHYMLEHERFFGLEESIEYLKTFKEITSAHICVLGEFLNHMRLTDIELEKVLVSLDYDFAKTLGFTYDDFIEAGSLLSTLHVETYDRFSQEAEVKDDELQ